VCLQVSDLPRAVEYYERVLGLRRQQVAPEMATLGAAGDAPPLITLRSREGVTRAAGGAFGLYHFAVLLPDRAALGRFIGHVSGLGVRAGTADHLVSESIYLRDPDGLGIEVYADRPAAEWRSNGGELVMATDPLDAGSVMAAARGDAWTGAPPGTTIGHVHLHVGNLAEAEAFYHRVLGFDKTVWTYPGALFMAAGGYHHHLGTNVWSPGPSPGPDRAQLLEWEIVVPSGRDVAGAADSLQQAGYSPEAGARGVLAADPWGTRVRIRAGNAE
jgi:catechol 2,3-dioxygenase